MSPVPSAWICNGPLVNSSMVGSRPCLADRSSCSAMATMVAPLPSAMKPTVTAVASSPPPPESSPQAVSATAPAAPRPAPVRKVRRVNMTAPMRVMGVRDWVLLGRRSSGELVGLLVVHSAPHRVPELGELVGEADVLSTRVGEVDVDHGVDPAWSRGHHHHPVGEVDRLVDVVGDEHDRAALLGPGVQQLDLHVHPGER